MIKSIFKEILITTALLAIIVALLAVVLYDYNPIVKTIPEAVKYEIPKDVSEELNTQVVPNDTKVIITYEVDNKDLNNSEDYNPGKKNPFAQYSKETDKGNPLGGSNSTANGSNNNGTGNSNNSSIK